MENDLIKISKLNPATEIKDSAVFPIAQDGQTLKASVPLFQQTVIEKVTDGFIRNEQKGAPNGIAPLDINSKVPNENLSFGKVEEGNSDVVSGGEVFELLKNNKILVENRHPYLTDDFDLFINLKDGTRFTKVDGIIKQHIGTDNIIFKYPNIFRFKENTIYQNKYGYFIDMSFYEEISKYYKDTPIYYVDDKNGKDTNSGLSKSAPMKTIRNAYELRRARNICVINYTSRYSSIATNFELKDSKSVIITAINNSCITSNDDATNYTWEAEDNVYKSNISAVFNIYDFSRYCGKKKGYFNFKLVSTLQECKSNPYTWFKNESNIVFINNGGSSINYSIKISRQQQIAKLSINSEIPFIYTESLNVYVQDPEGSIKFENTSVQYNTRVILNGVSSYGNKLGDAISFSNIKNVISLNNGGFECRRDALNYHTYNASYEKMKVIEVDCWSLDTGKDFPTEGSSNGSTAHDGMSIIRIGGNFDTSNGSTIVDVNEGIESLNLGVTAVNPTRTNTACFHVQNGNMWTYDCVALSNIQSFRQDGDSGNLFTFNNKKIGATFGNVQELSTY